MEEYSYKAIDFSHLLKRIFAQAFVFKILAAIIFDPCIVF